MHCQASLCRKRVVANVEEISVRKVSNGRNPVVVAIETEKKLKTLI